MLLVVHEAEALMQFSEFIIETRERSGLLPNDQMASDTFLGQLVNHALGNLEAGVPSGWPWLRQPDILVALTNGTGTYPFATLSAGQTWRKIRAVRMLVGTDFQELEPMNVTTMRRAFESQIASMPQSWSTDGYNLIVRPIPNDAWQVELDVTVGEPALVDPTDTPLIPDLFHDVVIDQAVAIVKRRTGDAQGAQEALAAVKDGLMQMRQFARTQGGHARTALREPWA